MKDLPRKLRLLQEGVANEAADYIEELERTVEYLGELAHVCTYENTKHVCSTCRCHRQEKKDG